LKASSRALCSSAVSGFSEVYAVRDREAAASGAPGCAPGCAPGRALRRRALRCLVPALAALLPAGCCQQQFLVDVVSDPRGATIFVNGEKVGAANLLCTLDFCAADRAFIQAVYHGQAQIKKVDVDQALTYERKRLPIEFLFRDR
jgi:hypothetical protein